MDRECAHFMAQFMGFEHFTHYLMGLELKDSSWLVYKIQAQLTGL